MGILFISHSSKDNEAALRVRAWLKDNGWNQVFLDLDPAQGLAAGHRWQQELKQAGERCSGVLVLISPSWIASRWCQTEFLVADQLGKKIFPLFVAPTPFDDLPPELKGKFQIADISTPQNEAEGFERLALGLKRAGLDPNSFPWPPPEESHRPIYRGLQSLDEQDAAIFFGRDALITKGLDAMRRMRDGAPERLLAIQGASGAGKSSFLKAGLIARLSRDEENFLVLPVIRPSRAALTGNQGLAASIGLAPARLGKPHDLVEAFAKLRAVTMGRLTRLAIAPHEDQVAKPPTIVVALDQAEELFAAENAEAAQVLDLLAGAARLDSNAIIVATIRSDAFAKLQEEPRLAEVAIQPFSLPPIRLGAFKEVIEGPARLASPPLTIEAALSDKLLQDLAAEDALPLLAFTLERLSSRHRGGGTLTLAEYAEEMGGLQGAIVGAVEAAFSQAIHDPALPRSHAELEKLARIAFIPALVHLDDADAEPARRVERLSALPEATRPLVRHMIDQRLLVSGRSVIDGIETDTIEVTHEAILRQWPALRAWIAEERDALRALDAARIASAEWRRHMDQDDGKSRSWLAHRGGRLQEAEALLTRSGFTSAFGSTELEYLAACREHENAEFLREQAGLARTRRLQRNTGILIAAAGLVIVFAGVGIVRVLGGMAARSSGTLANEAAKESDAGNYDRSARYALAGLTGADWPLIGFQGTQAETELRWAVNASSAVSILRGHDNQVLGAGFSPDGRRVVTASRDGTARVWDARTAREIAVLRGPKPAVMTAAYSPDGKRVVTACDDGTARIWEADTGREIAVLRGHTNAVASATYSPDGARIVTASWDGTARLWDAKSGRPVAILRGHSDSVESAAFSTDGKRIVTASDDKTAGIWDAVTAREIAVLRGHESAVVSAAFSSDGSHVVTASDDKTARVWDVRSAREIAVLRGHENTVGGASFSPDGARVVTGSRDKTARVWDAVTGREIAVLRGHDAAVNSASYSPDGALIVTTSDDKTARIWNASAVRSVIVLRGHEGIGINNAAFSSDGRWVVTASNDRTALIWSADTGQEATTLRGHGDLVESAAFSPDGRRVVTASDDRTARIWDASTGRELTALRGHRDAVYGAAFSPDGTRIATASRDKTVRIWDARSGHNIATLRGHEGIVDSAAFSPNGRRIATASSDKTARIWDASSGREIAVLRGHLRQVMTAAFSPDGTRVVTASLDKTVRLWDANSAKPIAVIQGGDDAILSAAFSPDGTRIVTASRDKTARIWDAVTGREIAALRGHQDHVTGAAFRFDGSRIVTSSDDGTARIWNVSTLVYTTRAELVRRACETSLANGLSILSASELQAAPVLDAEVDRDACHPPGLWTHLGRIFSAALSR